MAESNSNEKKPAANKGDNDVKVVMFADTKKRLRKCGKFVREHIHLIRTFSVLFAVSLCSGLVRNSYTFTGYVPKVCRIDIFGIFFHFQKSLNLIDITITYGPILLAPMHHSLLRLSSQRLLLWQLGDGVEF